MKLISSLSMMIRRLGLHPWYDDHRRRRTVCRSGLGMQNIVAPLINELGCSCAVVEELPEDEIPPR